MWLAIGILAIVATFINLYMYRKGKDYKLWMALGLSLTALTLCAEYTLVYNWVEAEDWAALQDVVLILEKPLWFLTITSILLNMTPVFLELIDNK